MKYCTKVVARAINKRFVRISKRAWLKSVSFQDVDRLQRKSKRIRIVATKAIQVGCVYTRSCITHGLAFSVSQRAFTFETRTNV